MKFKKREYHPAYDPVNAMLNLGYTMLTNEIDSLLEIAGFETEAGFLHGLRYGRSTLALDFIEPYRAMVIDDLVIYMINEKIVTKDDFKTTTIGCRFIDDKISIFFKEYSRHMHENNFRNIIRSQVIEIKKCVLEKMIYIPYRFE